MKNVYLMGIIQPVLRLELMHVFSYCLYACLKMKDLLF